MLEKDFQYYLNNREELLKKYTGRYLVIKGEKVIGDYSSEMDAYTETQKEHKLGTFLIQPCVADERSFQQSFHSRVNF